MTGTLVVDLVAVVVETPDDIEATGLVTALCCGVPLDASRCQARQAHKRHNVFPLKQFAHVRKQTRSHPSSQARRMDHTMNTDVGCNLRASWGFQ